MGRPRAHSVRLTALADGTTDFIDFNLNPGSHLVHVVIAIGPGGPPFRVSAQLIQPRVDSTSFNTLVGGWVRGAGTIATSGDLVWDGDIEIGTDMAIRFQARNDTGAAGGPGMSFIVVE